MTGRPVIIDCDPGIDDAIALLLALASPEEIDLLGITCVAGNVPLPLTLRNARIVVELSGRTDVPIYAGCARPMRRTLSTGERIHGKTGLDGYDWPEPSLVIGNGHAVDFIVETCLAAKDGAITLCPVGPMTNIATAIVKQPRILPKLREIAFMGGAALVHGAPGGDDKFFYGELYPVLCGRPYASGRPPRDPGRILRELGVRAEATTVEYRSDQPFESLEEACDFWTTYLGRDDREARDFLRPFLAARLQRQGGRWIAPYRARAVILQWRTAAPPARGGGGDVGERSG